jgi:hypothetical protein
MSFLKSSHNAWLMSEEELTAKRKALLTDGQSVESLLKAELAVSVPLLAALRSRHVPCGARTQSNGRFYEANRHTVSQLTRAALFDENVLDTATVFLQALLHGAQHRAWRRRTTTVFYTCLFVALKVEERPFECRRLCRQAHAAQRALGAASPTT